MEKDANRLSKIKLWLSLVNSEKKMIYGLLVWAVQSVMKKLKEFVF